MPPDRADARPAYPGASRYLPPRRTLGALADAMDGCRGCDLWERATRAVPGSGPAQARLMVVGEQPGDVEDVEGKPFVGPAGRLLDRALDEAGLERGDLYLTNAVKHFRHDLRGKRRIHESPTRWHVAACQPWLLAELDAVRPGGVVLLGSVAGKAAYGASFRVGASRGQVLDPPTPWADSVGWVVTTAHPSAVLRSRNRDADLKLLVADLSVAREALTG